MDRFRVDGGSHLSMFTLANYNAGIRSLIAHGLTDTASLTRAAVSDWIAARRAAGTSARTINSQFAGILSVLSSLERGGRFSLKRLLRLRRLRIRGLSMPSPTFLSAGDVLRLRRWALTVGRRLDLALCLAIFAGLRVDEVRRLRREALVLETAEPYLRVLLPTKNRKERTTPLLRAFADWLLAWGLPESGPLFPAETSTSHDGLVARATFRRWLTVARERAGLPHVTWFTCRHTFASILRQQGIGLGLVSGWMGNTVRICEAHYAALAPGGDVTIERGFGELWSLTRAPGRVA